jgi:hypothetical protein
MSDSNSDAEDLRHVCEEGRYTLNRQIEKIQLEGKKAVGITRLNLLLLGLFASAISVSLRTTNVPTAEFLNVHVGVGTAGLIMSTIVSAMAYTSSKYQIGINPNPLEEVRTNDVGHIEYYHTLCRKYTEWIDRNRDVHRFNSYAITWALIFALSGLLFHLLGLAVGIGELRRTSTSDVLLVVGFVLSAIIVFLLHNSDWFFESLMGIGNSD